MRQQLGECAVVVGASIGGLMAAVELTDCLWRVTVCGCVMCIAVITGRCRRIWLSMRGSAGSRMPVLRERRGYRRPAEEVVKMRLT